MAVISVTESDISFGGREFRIEGVPQLLPECQEKRKAMPFKLNTVHKLNKYYRFHKLRSWYGFFYRKHHRKNGQKLKFRTANKRVNRMKKKIFKSEWVHVQWKERDD